MTRRSLLPLLVLAAGLVAACAPITPAPPPPPPPPPPQPVPQYCAASVPASAEAYQQAFNDLRHTFTEWATADGAVRVALTPTKVLWMFGDTYVGTVQPNGLVHPLNAVTRNSFVVQDGRCFRPLMGGAPGARTDWVPGAGPGEFSWPAGGILDGSTLRIFLLRARSAPAPLHFEILGMQIATFSTSTFTMQGAPVNVPWTIDRPFGSSPIFDAATGFTYVYGSHNEKKSNGIDDPEQRHYVARAPQGFLAQPSAWQFWDGTTWSESFEDAAPMTFIGTPPFAVDNYPIDGPGGALSVSPAPPGAVGYAYVATAKLLDAFSDDVSVFTGPSPNGPWTYRGRAATTPGGGIASYSAYTHVGLPGTTGPVVGFSTNDSTFDTKELPEAIQVYGPRFVAPSAGVLP